MRSKCCNSEAPSRSWDDNPDDLAGMDQEQNATGVSALKPVTSDEPEGMNRPVASAASYFEGAQGLLDLCSILAGAQGLPVFLPLFMFLSIFLDEGAHGLLGAQGLAAACAMGAPDRLLSAWGIGATMAAASARVGRAWDNLRRE
jgi:hypothetical protein